LVSVNSAFHTHFNTFSRCILTFTSTLSLPFIYRAAGFAAPTSRRKAAEHTEKIKQTVDERHALYGARTPQRRLKSRNSFLGTVKVEPPEDFPLTQIFPGSHLLDFNTWKSLNRIRTGVAPVKTNMVKWGQKQTPTTCIVAVERYKICDISYHAGTALRNAPSRIYGLQIKKDLT
jgi:hypothetical protein